MGFGAAAAAIQFYIYGRRHLTAAGWRYASSKYDVAALDTVDLTGKVYLVTGANSGIGFCLSKYLASRGATLYMACRSPERAEAAKTEIVSASGSSKVFIVIADCGVKQDVARCIEEVSAHESALDGLVCNAGALLHERTETKYGDEVTFATHLLCGSYLLSQLALPLLRQSTSPRVLFVSSGGMYNTPWPRWELATSQPGHKYDGVVAYAYAKRGQVLLAERLTEINPDIKFVTCHPGWTDTPGVEAAFGKSKRILQPLRTLWQGTEGIAWLCGCDAKEIVGGEFYLDRSPQPKHIAGPFFTEGSYTKNSRGQVDEMMSRLASAVGQVPIVTGTPLAAAVS